MYAEHSFAILLVTVSDKRLIAVFKESVEQHSSVPLLSRVGINHVFLDRGYSRSIASDDELHGGKIGTKGFIKTV